MVPAKIRVAVVDGQPFVSSTFLSLLADEPDIRLVYHDPWSHDPVSLCRHEAVDVLLLDIRMPHLDGVAATREITEAGPRPSVLILTTVGDGTNVVGAIAAGAAGFLRRDCEPSELISAIRAAHRQAAVL